MDKKQDNNIEKTGEKKKDIEEDYKIDDFEESRRGTQTR